MNLLIETYNCILLQTKRGNSQGVFSNAKIVFLLSIIDSVEKGAIVGNKIQYGNAVLQDIYKSNSQKYLFCDASSKNNAITPFRLPFFHLNTESYYHIKWKCDATLPKQSQSPSGKFLHDNIDYCFLDEPLWTLLQDKEVREVFRSSLISHFLGRTHN